MLNKEELLTILESTQTDANIAEEVAQKMVKEYTAQLDAVMDNIKKSVMTDYYAVPDSVVENFLIELTGTLYYVVGKCEALGLLDDVAKQAVVMEYNRAFTDNQLRAANEGKKSTVKESEVCAENASISHKIVNNITTRVYKITNAKILAAQSMVSALSKIVTKRMRENSVLGGSPSPSAPKKVLNEKQSVAPYKGGFIESDDFPFEEATIS